jgi:hypothetical protein
MLRAAGALVATLAVGATTAHAGTLSSPYTDPRYLVEFGEYSHYIQPWRAYLETVPAATFLDGAGVQFNLNSGEDNDLVAEMLRRNGVKHVRIEIGWGNFSYDDEDQINPGADEFIRKQLRAARTHGLRPMILLNAHEGLPTPTHQFYVTAAADTPAGARTLELQSTDGLVARYSGLTGFGSGTYRSADVIFTAIDGNTVTISKPLARAVTANESLVVGTERYRPFGDPDNPLTAADYRQTADGWKRYVGNVARIATEEVGPGAFDLEVWNELTFGSSFLDINNYYDPPLISWPFDDDSRIWMQDVVKETSDEVDEHPANFAGVTISDGFANTTPWQTTSSRPKNITAVSKHPYPPDKLFPRDDVSHIGAYVHVDALLNREPVGSQFIPSYGENFPEYFATEIQTETMARETAPFTSEIYGSPDGRYARPGGPVTTWFTEFNISPEALNPNITAQAALDLKAKSTARSLAFFLNKGVTQLDFYGAVDSDKGLGMVQDNFLDYARTHPGGAYPASDATYTSPALRVIKRMGAKFSTGLDRSLTLATTRPISVTSISDTHNQFQFNGDGTAAHPKLFNRDVLAILPYQVNGRRFVIPFYVQTRNILPALAPAQYDIDLSGLRGRGATVSAYDPIKDTSSPVSVLNTGTSRLKVRVQATDYPILLTVQENG